MTGTTIKSINIQKYLGDQWVCLHKGYAQSLLVSRIPKEVVVKMLQGE